MSDLSHVDDDDFEDIENGEGDEGGAGDSHEGEDEGDPQDEDDEGQGEGELQGQRQPVEGQRRNRANDSVRRLRERAQAAEDRATRFEREMDDLRRQVNSQNYQPSRAELERQRQEEDERVALMSPAEQIRYYRDLDRQERARERQIERAQDMEARDRDRFQDMQRTNPLARKYATEVETLVKEQRNQGLNTPREVALAFIIGRKALDKVNAGGGPSREQRGRVRGSTAQPTRGGTDGRSTGRGREADDSEAGLERRLAGVTF